MANSYTSSNSVYLIKASKIMFENVLKNSLKKKLKKSLKKNQYKPYIVTH